MRALLLATCLILLATSCDGADAGPSAASPSAAPTRSVGSSTTSPSESTPAGPSSTPSPTVEISLQLPKDAPISVEEPLSATQIASEDYAALAPPGATVTFTSVLTSPQDPLDQIALVWGRGDDAFASEHGVVLWQRFGSAPAWRALYAFTDRPSAGVLGIDLDVGELTADGVPDLLTFEQMGGTGACGTWRVIASAIGAASEIFREDTCDTEVRIAGDGLEVRAAVFGPNDPHCCPSAFRVSRLEWDGQAFAETRSEIVETSA